MICNAEQLARDVEAYLREMKFPVRVVFGPELCPTAGNALLIVLDYDREASDTAGVSAVGSYNPKRRAVRLQALKASFFGVSRLAGARYSEHCAVCDSLVDAFWCGVVEWLKAGSLSPQWGGGRYVGNDVDPAGVRYDLQFAIPRAVDRLDFSGHGYDSTTITDVTTTVS